MQHSIHVMFGKASSEALLELRRYIAMYSNEQTSEYFTALQYIQEDNGDILIQKVVKKPEEQLTFTSHLNEQWIPMYQEEFKASKENAEDELHVYLNKNLWSQRISQNTQGEDSLLFCLHVPLYLPEIWQEALFFIKQIKQHLASKRVLIDIVGFCDEFAEVLEPGKEAEYVRKHKELKENVRQIFDEIIAIKTKKATASYINNFVVLQGQTNTRSLEFTFESIISVMGEYALICITNYNDAYGRGIAKKDVQGIGISMLSFDKYYFQEYLLQDSFIKILEKERLDDNEVDIQWAAHEIDTLLQPWLKIMYVFYRTEMDPRREQEVQLTEIMPEIHPKLQKKFEEINEAIVNAIMRNETLSLPQKKGLLSILLGQDDELFAHGTLINSEQTILIDLERECVNFFIDENNALLDRTETKDEIILPPYSQLVGEAAVTDAEGHVSKKAKLPTDELKELRFRQRNYIANIREMEDEIAELKKNLTQLNESKKCLIEGGKIIFEKQEYQLLQHDDDIVPLSDNYEPHAVTTKNLDISNGFTEIKNQGQQGACMSFSMVSVFEYFLKKNHAQFPDLSEQFLYYNARKRIGKEMVDEGSTSVGSIQTLQEDGICSEEAWPYKVGGFAEEPSAEAYKEAKRRRVKRAVMVEKKIETLKSALDDGLPVVFIVDLFPSFVQGVNGFVSMPSEEEVKQLKESGEKHSHAMVLCGFNEEQRVFKVRNSWGKEFGDGGYCYLSYDYIMQYGYWDCIAIQEIEVAQEIEGGGEEVERLEDTVFTIIQNDRPQLNFSETDLVIRYALRKNFLDRLKKELSDLQQYDAKIQEYYEAVKLPLRNRNKRDALYRAAKKHKELQIADWEQEKEDNGKKRKLTIREYDKETWRKSRKGITSFISLATTFGVLDGLIGKGILTLRSSIFNWIPTDFLMLFVDRHSIFGRIIGWLLGNGGGGVAGTLEALQGWMRFLWILFVIGALAYAGFYIWYRYEKRKDIEKLYDDILKNLNWQIADMQSRLKMLEPRFHLAGEVLSNLGVLQRTMQGRHSAIAHYIMNLKEWLRVTREAHEHMRAEARAPFVSLIRNDVLERYFEAQQEAIIHENNVWHFIENYEASEEGIIRVQQEIKKDLLEKINTHYASFSVADYLIRIKETDTYPYLVHDFQDICELFKDLNKKSDLFLQYKLTKAGSDARQVMLIQTKDEEQSSVLSGQLKGVMPTNMSMVTTSSPYKIIFFSKRELDKEQVEL